MANKHYLKTLVEYFEDICSRKKKFELRLNDRNFKVGDTLILEEFDGENYTGNYAYRIVTYILDDAERFGLMKGFVIMGID